MFQGVLALAWTALAGRKLRSALSVLGFAVGVGTVVLLGSIGEGTRDYLLEQFSQFGTNIIAIHPGKSETFGVPGVLGGSTKPLTIEDAEALRRLPGVESVVPVALGSGPVERRGRSRNVFIYGVTPDMARVMALKVRYGSFWPSADSTRGSMAAVLGPTVERELFGESSALGETVRIAGSRYRVIGIMEAKGQMLGFDIDDAVYIPVASAMSLFNLEELHEIDVQAAEGANTESVIRAIKAELARRHDGEEDVTVTSQDAMLEVFDNVMNIVTLSVSAIGGISMFVGAIGILTMMWIAVGERTSEIGLMRALGASRKQVRLVFLLEAAVIATLGALIGILVAMTIRLVLGLLAPVLPLQTPLLYIFLALAMSLLVGLASGVLPAERAAALEPIDALRSE